MPKTRGRLIVGARSRKCLLIGSRQAPRVGTLLLLVQLRLQSGRQLHGMIEQSRDDGRSGEIMLTLREGAIQMQLWLPRPFQLVIAGILAIGQSPANQYQTEPCTQQEPTPNIF